MTRTALALLISASTVAGCAPTLVAVRSFRGHAALDEHALTTLSELAEDGRSNKASVLTELGPPVGVLGQGAGEVFVYRYVARDMSGLNLNPAYVVPSAPSVPIYVDNNVSGRNDVLMVFFDDQGQVLGASMRRDVDEVMHSRAASQSELVRGWIE